MGAKNIIQEIQVKYKRPRLDSMQKVKSWEDAERVFREVMDMDRIDLKEFFWVMLLSRSSHVLAVSQISVGSTGGTIVNIKEIFQLVLKTNASAVILCHNHPSGNLKPSQTDIALTEKIKQFANMIEVSLFDHLIMTSEGCFSFIQNDIGDWTAANDDED